MLHFHRQNNDFFTDGNTSFDYLHRLVGSDILAPESPLGGDTFGISRHFH
jgi:hypothetical protein